MTFTPPPNHKKYHHTARKPIKKLKKGKVLYIADEEGEDHEDSLMYAVYLPENAKIFGGHDVFRDQAAADFRGNVYWEIKQEYTLPHREKTVEEFCEKLGFDPDDYEELEAYLESWFLNRNNYTEEGLSLIDELDLFNRLGPYDMSEYFANEQADPVFLNEALKKRGYDGRYESEQTSPWIMWQIPPSVCVFDQSILTLDPTPIYDWRRNPKPSFTPPSNHRKYYHATNTPIQNLRKGEELYIGDGEMPIGGKLTYVVYLPTSAKIFSGIDVFKNLHAADKRGNIYWEINQEYSPPHRAVQVEEFSKDLGIDPDDREALEAYLESWFLDRNNYTEEGLSIIDELDLFNRLGPYDMSEYFANEQADPSFLNKALEKRGYDGRYELEETSPWLIENVPQSVCVFDQSILTIDPTPITGRLKLNPYSHSKCDDLIEELRAEVESINVPEVVKSLADMLLDKKYYALQTQGPLPPDLVNFLDELPRVKTVEEYRRLFLYTNDRWRRLWRKFPWQQIRYDIFRFLPLGMLVSNFRIVKNVDFAHTLPKQRAEEIEESGILYGRSTLSRLTVTRELSDLYVPNDGFIFAYDLDTYLNEDPVVIFSTYLSGNAQYAVRFWFDPDEEEQLIIPVSCISEYQIDEWPSEYTPLEGWHDEYAYELPHPSRWTAGALRECDECEEEFPLDAGAIIGQDLLCKKCRP